MPVQGTVQGPAFYAPRHQRREAGTIAPTCCSTGPRAAQLSAQHTQATVAFLPPVTASQVTIAKAANVQDNVPGKSAHRRHPIGTTVKQSQSPRSLSTADSAL